MTDDLETLRQRAAEIHEKISRAEAVYRFEKGVKLVGKCFRYRNCYSCPKSDDDYWWMYTRVINCTKDGALMLFNFQTDQYGDVSIEPNKRRSLGLSLGEPITLKQFQHAWKIQARMLNSRAQSAKAVSP